MERRSRKGIEAGNRQRMYVATAALALPVIVAPQLLGGAIIEATLLICFGVVLAGAVIAWQLRSEAQTTLVPVPLLLCLVPLVWTVLQALPLPCSLVATLAPDAAEGTLATLNLFGERTIAHCTISHDPGATQLQIIVGCALFVSTLSGMLVATHDRRRVVLALVGLSVVAMALVSIGHRVAQADQVFGFYRPLHVATPVLGPLLNPNQLSGFLAMGIPPLLVLSLRSRGSHISAFWWVGLLFTVLAAVITPSRAGMLSWSIACVASVVVLTRARSSRSDVTAATGHAYQTPLLIVALLICAGVGIHLNFSELAADVSGHRYEKFEVIAQAFRFSLRQPWLGVGRGAFSSAFVASEGTAERYTHPESLPAQWVAEWGYPVALLALGALLWALVQAFRSAHSRHRQAALLGVLIIAFHDLADFALEMLGVAVVAGALLGASLVSRAKHQRAWAAHLSARTLLAVGSALTLTLLVVLGPSLLRADVAQLEQALRAPKQLGSLEAFRARLEEGLRQHPREPSLVLLGANDALLRDDPQTLRWLNRAMELAPGWPAPHLLTAHWLLRRQRYGQALLELREAEIRHPNISSALLCELLRQKPDAELFLRICPAGDPCERMQERAATCSQVDPAVIAAFDAHRTEQGTTATGPRVRAAHRLLDSGDHDAALRQFEAAIQQAPEDLLAYEPLIHALLRLEEFPRALVVIEQAARVQPRASARLLTLRAKAEAALGQTDAMEATLEALRGLAAANPQRLAEVLQLESQLQLQLGHTDRALAAMQQAVQLQPTAHALKRLAALATRVGATATAQQVMRQLCELYPHDHRDCSHTQTLLP